MTKKYTTQEYKQKYYEKHGKSKRYDLSKVDYTRAHDDIEVVCIDHGSFFIKAYSFLQGKGCPGCGGNEKLTPESFNEKGEEEHGVGKYDYSHIFEIPNNKTKVPIDCNNGHGIFWQTPNDHLGGHGCSKCYGNAKQPLEKLIKRFHNIFNDFYDYSENKEKDIENNKSILKVGCPIHGFFHKRVADHLNKQGCFECYKGKYYLDPETFIQRSNEFHGHVYDYRKVKQNWKNTYTAVEIICSIHGSFFQTPKNHLSGRGCPTCGCAKTRISKNQRKLFENLQKHFIDKEIILEYSIKTDNKRCYADICFSKDKIVIEYYGDYWHCNPKKYKPDYFHKNYKTTAKNIWTRDLERQKRLEDLGYKVFIIWEDDFKKDEKNVILDIINKIEKLLKI